ncbi:MAG: undecaprenyl/decaprenyl-phosphate alpha-N-acetylglucosaminyl 1-phosphate transferase [Chitinophagaceae bacterium]|jgi:UDP-GlcNAc:undecaprenyl-phosphate GlcNAc-1-phosphate transferase|nr:undecaprenyl/decaprenyl-phosphate alpha-N-acetylglucosaminyl 1-phosphate transferase [Chitinophagaceae bacterium]
MQSLFINTALSILASLVITYIVLQLLIKYSVQLKLVDIPNERKLHKTPIPSIGGLGIVIAILLVMFIIPLLRSFLVSNYLFFLCFLLLSITGIVDDRLDISAKVRLVIEVACAFAVAHAGVRLTSLHGILGITILPVFVQYALTIFILTGVTNAFNLIDGIDGLAGGIAITNIIVLAVLSFVAGMFSWFTFFITAASSLLVFLKLNWRPAKLFMGDGGSLPLGFIMAAAGILLINQIGVTKMQYLPTTIVLVAISFLIPVIDTVRVFYTRLSKGKSPFAADKNHLHHWLIRQHLVHNQATKRVLGFHIVLLLFALIGIQLYNITVVIITLTLLVILYTKALQMSSYFHRWYKFVKRMEAAK